MRNSARKQIEKGNVTPLSHPRKLPVQAPGVKKKKPFIYLLALLFFYFVFLFSTQFVRYIQVNNELKALNADIAAIEEENMALKAEIEQLHDLDYLEELARGRLGMVKRGEILFYIRGMNGED